MTQASDFAFRQDSYLSKLATHVSLVLPDGGVVLDDTIFYATSGGQPADHGFLEIDGNKIAVLDVYHPDGDKSVVAHRLAEDADLPQPGVAVICHIDWARRHRLMRMHTAMHLATVVFPFPITGASVGTEKGRIDFDMPELPDEKDRLQDALNALVLADYSVTSEWISDAELDANPGLVKSLSVSPPRGQGQVRLVRIGGSDALVDLQPCGGTHVRSTAEIGPLRIGKIEKKGKQNRRVNLFFDEVSPQ